MSEMFVSDKVTSADIKCALKTRLPAGEYALFFEVRNAAGFEASRSADAVAINLWPSRGLEILGFEIKVSRADWLRELKNPGKAEAIFKYCDRWVILAPVGVVSPSELPKDWGLWELSEKVKWVNPITPGKLSPQPLDRTFVAALLKRAGQVDDGMIAAAVAKLRGNDEATYAARVTREVEMRTREATRLMTNVKEFEAAAGIQIEHGWLLGDVGTAVKLILERKSVKTILEDASNLRDRLSALIDAATPAIDAALAAEKG